MPCYAGLANSCIRSTAYGEVDGGWAQRRNERLTAPKCDITVEPRKARKQAAAGRVGRCKPSTISSKGKLLPWCGAFPTPPASESDQAWLGLVRQWNYYSSMRQSQSCRASHLLSGTGRFHLTNRKFVWVCGILHRSLHQVARSYPTETSTLPPTCPPCSGAYPIVIEERIGISGSFEPPLGEGMGRPPPKVRIWWKKLSISRKR